MAQNHDFVGPCAVSTEAEGMQRVLFNLIVSVCSGHDFHGLSPHLLTLIPQHLHAPHETADFDVGHEMPGPSRCSVSFPEQCPTVEDCTGH